MLGEIIRLQTMSRMRERQMFNTDQEARDAALEILGIVPPCTDEEEIKSAYRRLANQHHPDKPTGEQTKFQEIKEAYEFLTEGKTSTGKYKVQPNEIRFGGGSTTADSDAMMAHLHEMMRQFAQQMRPRSNPPFTDVEAATLKSVVEDSIKRMQHTGRTSLGDEQFRRNHGLWPHQVQPELEIVVSFEESFGAVKRIQKKLPNASKEFKFDVPRGLNSHELLIGVATDGSKEKLVAVGVLKKYNQYYGRRLEFPHDLYATPLVNAVDMMIGGTILLPDIEKPDTWLEIKVPEGHTHLKELRVAGKGLPIKGSGRGDLTLRPMAEVTAIEELDAGTVERLRAKLDAVFKK